MYYCVTASFYVEADSQDAAEEKGEAILERAGGEDQTAKSHVIEVFPDPQRDDDDDEEEEEA
jgi:hypothetical protein